MRVYKRVPGPALELMYLVKIIHIVEIVTTGSQKYGMLCEPNHEESQNKSDNSDDHAEHDDPRRAPTL